MPRGLTAPQRAQLAKRVRGAPMFVDLYLSTGHVRIWNGKGAIDALGSTWTGLGEFGIIEGIESDTAVKAGSISVSLAGIPATAVSGSAIAEARGIRYQGRPVTVYLGVTDENGALVGDPVPIWVGSADVMTFRLGATVSCTLTCEHLDSLLRRSNGLRMSTENHNRRLGNPATRDLFFDPQDRLMGKVKPAI